MHDFKSIQNYLIQEFFKWEKFINKNNSRKISYVIQNL